MRRLTKPVLVLAAAAAGLVASSWSPRTVAAEEPLLQAYFFWTAVICQGECVAGYCCKLVLKPPAQ